MAIHVKTNHKAAEIKIDLRSDSKSTVSHVSVLQTWNQSLLPLRSYGASSTHPLHRNTILSPHTTVVTKLCLAVLFTALSYIPA